MTDQVQAPSTPRKFFYGRFEHAVDKGRRVMIPSRWRTNLHDEFMILAWPLESSQCLMILPPERSERAFQSIGEDPLTDEKAGKFVRAIGYCSHIEELDDSGRLLLREELAQRVGIKNDVILVGCRTYFEIWAPDRFQAALVDTLASAAATAKEKNL